jgi:hypothetical protein
MADDLTIPSTPNPQLVTYTAAIIRSILQAIGGGMTLFGLTCSFCNPSEAAILGLAGPLVILGTVAWSIYQKIRAAQRDHAGNVASAKATLANGVATPVKVV